MERKYDITFSVHTQYFLSIDHWNQMKLIFNDAKHISNLCILYFLSTWSIFCPHNLFSFHMMCFLSTQHNNCLSLFETVFDSSKLIYRDWCSWFYDNTNFFPHNVFSFHISYFYPHDVFSVHTAQQLSETVFDGSKLIFQGRVPLILW